MLNKEQNYVSETLQQKIKRIQDQCWIGDPAQRMGELHAVIAELWAENQRLRTTLNKLADEADRQCGDAWEDAHEANSTREQSFERDAIQRHAFWTKISNRCLDALNPAVPRAEQSASSPSPTLDQAKAAGDAA
jgi:hypothetical protein